VQTDSERELVSQLQFLRDGLQKDCEPSSRLAATVMPNGAPIDRVLAAELTEKQCGAATDTAREVLTLACAGSGKSRTLAFRIAWLIAEQQADPTGIVAFTFTEKAADSIKLRVADA